MRFYHTFHLADSNRPTRKGTTIFLDDKHAGHRQIRCIYQHSFNAPGREIVVADLLVNTGPWRLYHMLRRSAAFTTLIKHINNDPTPLTPRLPRLVEAQTRAARFKIHW